MRKKILFSYLQSMVYKECLFYATLLGSGYGAFFGLVASVERINRDKIGIKDVALALSYPIVGAYAGAIIGFGGVAIIFNSITIFGMITIIPVATFFNLNVDSESK